VKFIFALAAFLLSIVPAAAQTTALPNQALGWTQAAADLAEAQSLRYDLDLDGTTTALQGHMCGNSTIAGQFDCFAPLPAMTPGAHILRLRSVRLVSGTELASAFSAPLNIVMIAVPSTPTNVRLVNQ
jgi:hypothetical protein